MMSPREKREQLAGQRAVEMARCSIAQQLEAAASVEWELQIACFEGMTSIAADLAVEDLRAAGWSVVPIENGSDSSPADVPTLAYSVSPGS